MFFQNLFIQNNDSKTRMPRCPNCSYILVLLEHRRKYKCAKCGKLFPQKEIDDLEFQEWNKKERNTEKVESRKAKKTADSRAYQKKNPEKVNAQQRRYYAKNKDKMQARQRHYRQKNKEKALARERAYRNKHKDKINAQRRKSYWKHHDKEQERQRKRRENDKQHRTHYNKQWIQKNAQRRKQWLSKYLLKNRQHNLSTKRLSYWRHQQVRLIESKK